MEIKNLFDDAAYNEIVDRINKLTPESKREWGKMNVSQMLAHCKEAFKVPLSPDPLPRMFFGRIIGGMIKHKMYDKSVTAKNLPTAPSFKIKDERDFQNEKTALLDLISQFHAGSGKVGKHPHPFFGVFSNEQWGQGMWKHLDHHLRQFGV